MKWISLLVLIGCAGTANDPKPKLIELPTAETILVSVTDSVVYVMCNSDAQIRGVCWGTTINPDITDSWAEGGKVSFSVQARKEYHVRAFARNGAGVAYGNDIKLLTVCPSNIGGSYFYSTISSVCSATGVTTLTDNGNGVYSIGDASFGIYGCAWGDGPATGVKLEDTCGKFEFVGMDQYGVSYFLTVVSKNPFVLDWHNDFGDSGITTLTK